MEPLGGRGEGAGGFINMAPLGGAGAIAGGFGGGEVTAVLPLPAERVLEGGEGGERDLERES